ncbi:stalk domain-containing protein [Petrocella sp. FN5]|uniref:stalk domain-containing protein n=1 Tax=Petrocella sp. FN5 TaxID=3032002 RepID=UPI0023DA35C3|nr:phosphodiester glycosidase family protein [Petrocella sp. FN5]MDF1617844.1 phosphodiester glycosidase family protein [Petrocella sp. FN5]
MKLGQSICILFVALFIAVSILPPTLVQAQSSVWKESRSVSYTGGSKNISVLWADLKDDKIRIDSVLAHGKIGATDALSSIVQSASNTDGAAIGGINGSFFNAYADMQPSGTLMVDGEVLHMANTGSVLAISGDNRVSVDPLFIKIVGGTNGQWEWPYNWYSWNINHYYTDPAATMIFTPEYAGPRPSHDFTSIEVDKGVVTKKSTGSFHIPTDGFLVLTKDVKVSQVFELGKTAEYRMEYYANDFTTANHTGVSLDYDHIRTVVGAGPTLVKNGKLKADAGAEGFTEGKITSSAATRSLIGVTADNKLGMAVVSGVTVKQLGEIAQSLGMVEAMNLDGGGSSGLYYNGSYIATPGRLLSNAVVIKILNESPMTILLNNKPLFFDTEPYLNKTYNRTLVPLRGITEALGASVGWNGATSSITIERLDTKLELKVGSASILVNGKSETMDVPVLLKDSRTYVPLRFITQYFGGDVKWIQESKTVELTIGDATRLIEQGKIYEASNQYDEAKQSYLTVLEMDARNIFAAKRLAVIYASLSPDKLKAIEYYEKVYELDPKDAANVSSLAWAYYGNMQLEEAIDMFLIYHEMVPSSGVGYYGAAVCYSHYQKNEVKSAVKYYKLALEKALTPAQIDFAVKYIQEHE